ncbi:peptidase M20, partial [Erysipelothrix rhusiopathiae]|nr:peptidase M20 [Erysipelothrix rhusiopathiae]
VKTTGGTYAKIIPNIIAFGPSFPGQKDIAHLPDEWMNLDDIFNNAKIYSNALYKLKNL